MSVSLPDKILAIHEQLGKARIPHAFGGALALAYYAEPRATNDVDVNVFVPATRWSEVTEALGAVGVDSSMLSASDLERDGQCRLWWGDNPIDLFFSYDAIHEEMRKKARRVPFAGGTLLILSPEHLAICKAMFDRTQDWIDLEQMLVAGDVDVLEVESWLTRMLGPDDRRLRRLRDLKGETPEA